MDIKVILEKKRSPRTVLADSKKLMAKVKQDRTFRTDFLCIAIGIIVLVLALAGVTALVISPMLQEYIPWKYGVIIQTDSSDTRVNVFQWEGAKVEGTGVVVPLLTCDIDVDLEMFMVYPEKAWTFMEACVNKTKRILSKAKTNTPHRTFIYMGVKETTGTSLDISSDVIVESMAIAENHLLASGYQFESGNLFQLSSHDEAVYNWVAVNYNKGLIDQNTDDQDDLYGLIEWGNYHLTIAFIPSDRFKDIAPSVDITDLTLYMKDYSVFSQAYDCVGRMELHARFLTMIIKMSEYSSEVTDPCLNTGRQITVDADNTWNTDCTKSSKPGSGITLPDTYHITGDFDMTTCLAIITDLMNTSGISLTCDDKPCSFGMIQTLNPSGQFMATHYFGSTMDALGYSGEQDYYTLFRAAFAFCETDYVDVTASQNETHLCLDALFGLKLLREGFDFDSADWGISFSSSFTVNDTWPIGFMLNASNSIAEDSTRVIAIFSDKYYFIFLVLVHSVVVVGILFVVYGVCIRKAQVHALGYRNVIVRPGIPSTDVPTNIPEFTEKST